MTKKFEKLPLIPVTSIEMRINPRKTMETATLMNEIIKDGEIRVPLVVWDLLASVEAGVLDDNVWERLSLSKDVRFVAVCGHRRLTCAKHIAGNPDKFSAVLVASVKALAANVVVCSEVEAREMANDDGGKAFLCKGDTVAEIFRMFAKDYSWQTVAERFTQYAYLALLSNGDAKHKKACEILDGSERRKKILADLKNVLDQHLKSAHLLGPAIVDQVVEWFHQKRDGHKARLVLLADWKLDTLRALREVYTKAVKDEEQFTPITKLEYADGNVTIEGGSVSINAALEKIVKTFINPEIGGDDRKPELPKATDRDAVKMASRSKVGKLTAAFYCGGASEERAAADEAAYYMESRANALMGIEPKSNAMRGMLMQVLTGRNMEDIVAVVKAVDEMLVSAETTKTSKGGKK